MAREKGKEIYIRNVFLQGLLLLDPEDSPVESIKPQLKKIPKLVKKFGLTRHELAIGYLRENVPWAKLIFGAETPDQVEENVKAYKKEVRFSTDLVMDVIETFPNVDENVLIPKMWRQNEHTTDQS